MSNYAAAAAEAGDKYLETLAEGQARFIDYIRTSREMMPPMPEPRTPATALGLPTMQDVAAVQFGFATKMLEQQRKFFNRLYTVSGKQPAARSATSRAVTAPARKTKTKARRSKTTSKPRPVS